MNIKKLVKTNLVLGMVFLYGAAMALKSEMGKGENVSSCWQALVDIEEAQGNVDSVEDKVLKAISESQNINPESLESKKRTWTVAQRVLTVATIPVGIVTSFLGAVLYGFGSANGEPDDGAKCLCAGIFLVPTGLVIAGAVGAGNRAKDCERQLQKHAQTVRDSKNLKENLDTYSTKVNVLLGFDPKRFTLEEKLTLWSLLEKNQIIHEKFNKYAVSYPVNVYSVRKHIFCDPLPQS